MQATQSRMDGHPTISIPSPDAQEVKPERKPVVIRASAATLRPEFMSALYLAVARNYIVANSSEVDEKVFGLAKRAP
jgi:hypothetical protein